ncbi:MAG: transposase [Endozoicomonadaceae bacterium]|nr:transposase [Endozoicomonadaceae bacterium]
MARLSKGSAWNKGKDAIHRVNGWCTEAGLSLGQYKVDAKSNEITAIPELVKLLELSDSLVTIDAMEGKYADPLLNIKPKTVC